MVYIADVPASIDGFGTSKSFFDRALCQHVLLREIASDRDSHFTGNF